MKPDTWIRGRPVTNVRDRAGQTAMSDTQGHRALYLISGWPGLSPTAMTARRHGPMLLLKQQHRTRWWPAGTQEPKGGPGTQERAPREPLTYPMGTRYVGQLTARPARPGTVSLAWLVRLIRQAGLAMRPRGLARRRVGQLAGRRSGQQAGLRYCQAFGLAHDPAG